MNRPIRIPPRADKPHWHYLDGYWWVFRPGEYVKTEVQRAYTHRATARRE